MIVSELTIEFFVRANSAIRARVVEARVLPCEGGRGEVLVDNLELLDLVRGGDDLGDHWVGVDAVGDGLNLEVVLGARVHVGQGDS